MLNTINIRKSRSGIHWTSYSDLKCQKCGEHMKYHCHGNKRTLMVLGIPILIIMCYYICNNGECDNKKPIVARHPEIIFKKKHSKSTFVKVLFLRYVKKFTVKQILDEMPYLKPSICYEIINIYRAARRAGADKRIVKIFPPGSKVRVSIDGMEPEKGQPMLYTIRETVTGVLLAAAFLENATAEVLYELMSGIEKRYGIIIVGMVSDKQKSIIAMHDKYYRRIPIQYCTVHYMKNVTKDLRGGDKKLQKNIRSEVRKLSVLKTILAKLRQTKSDLSKMELKVLIDTRKAFLSLVNQKKKEMFDLAGIAIYENLAKASEWLRDFMCSDNFTRCSNKFKLLLTHLSEKIEEILANFKDVYEILTFANEYIHPMFGAVMNPDPKHPKREFKKVIKEWKQLLRDKSIPIKLRGLIKNALKVAHSYERGLFVWLGAKLPKTNNGMESFYNEKKGNYRQYSRNKKIGITLQLTGLEEMYIPRDLTEEDIESDLEEIGSLEYMAIRDEMNGRKAVRKFSRYCRKDIISALGIIFEQLEGK